MSRIFHVQEDLLRQIADWFGPPQEGARQMRSTDALYADLKQILDVGPVEPRGGTLSEKLDGANEKLDTVIRGMRLLDDWNDRAGDEIAQIRGELAGAASERNRIERRTISWITDILVRLGGAPKQGMGYATLDTLDEKISTLFVGLEKMGMPQSWLSRAETCERCGVRSVGKKRHVNGCSEIAGERVEVVR